MAGDISYFGLTSETLPTGWREDRLDSIALFNPEQIGNEFYPAFIEYLDISNVGKGTLGNPEHLALENAPSRAKRIVAVNDTIISTVRPGNRAYAFLNELLPNLIVSTGFAVLRAKDSDPRFLYYLATSDPIIDYLASIAEEKTAYPSVNPGDIAECLVPIPPLPEQRLIAHILGTLDDKIELNRKMNETLEAMARAIFNYYFPYSPEDKLPEGWRVGRLGDVADVNWGDTNTTKRSYVKDGYPAYSASGQDGFLDYFDFDRMGVVVSAIGANSGDTWLAMDKWSCIKNTIRFWATDDSVSTEYLFHATRGKDKWPLRGSAQPFISQTDARNMRVVLRYGKLAKTFGDEVRPIYQAIKQNEQMSRTLAALRDLLLPKLLSGEIRVKDAARLVEAKA